MQRHYYVNDGEMVQCSQCGLYEHLSCRGRLHAPDGEHICNYCTHPDMEFKEQYLNVVNERWGHSSRGRAKLEHMLSGQLISSDPSHTLPSGMPRWANECCSVVEGSHS